MGATFGPVSPHHVDRRLVSLASPLVTMQPVGQMGPNGPPVYVISQNTQKEVGRRAQLSNIAAAKMVADVLRTSLGPRAMLKMLLSDHGGVSITNDGHAILREIDVNHPAAKSLIEISRSQDEEVGDGTTSVIIIAGDLLFQAE